MSQPSQADLVAKLRRLHELNSQQSELVRYVYGLTQSVCQEINRELGGSNGLTVSERNNTSIDVLFFSLPTGLKWTIDFDGEILADCTIHGPEEIMKPGFSLSKQKVSLSFVVAGYRYCRILIGDEPQWCRMEEQGKTFAPIKNLEQQVRNLLIEEMAKKADTHIQDRSPQPLK